MAPHHLESIIIIAGPLIFGALLLVVPLFNKGERSVRRRPFAALLVVFIWTMIVVFWVAGERAPWSPDFDAPAADGAGRGQQRSAGARGGEALPPEGVPVLPCGAWDAAESAAPT